MAFFAPILLDAALKGAIVLALASLLSVLCWKAPAARRQRVWLGAMVVALLLPVAATVLPAWRTLPRALDPQAAMMAPERAVQVGAPVAHAPGWRQRFVESWQWWIVLGWACGAAGALLPRTGAALVRWDRVRRGRRIEGAAWGLRLNELRAALGVHQVVVLLISPDDTPPTTWGGALGARPRILLPKDAQQWSDERCRAVLAHELATIRQRFGVTRAITPLACAVHWFNPLIWLAAQQSQLEGTRAVDELVARSGQRPDGYAAHVLDLVYGVPTPGSVAEDAAAGRFDAPPEPQPNDRATTLLNRQRRRLTLAQTAVVAVAALLPGIAVPGVMLQLHEDAGVRATLAAHQRSPRPEPQPAPAPPTPTITPRTLEERNPAPGAAVVLGQPIRWWSSHWSSDNNTPCAAMLDAAEHPKFVVTAPGRRKVWVKYFDVPIDARQRYPILVMRYRATGAHARSSQYTLYLDDGTGPDYGGLRPIVSRDLQADGQAHVITRDLRELDPRGDLIGMAIGVHAVDEPESPATFELIDLRFESDQDEPEEVTLSDRRWQVRVTDTEGAPIEGAAVTIDAGRRNWARTTHTDTTGLASVRPYTSATGRHMIRVTAEGRLPVEVRDVPIGDGASDAPIAVTLPAAAVYQGRVVNRDGEPVANVAVRLKRQAPHDAPANRWTRRDAEALTDADGRWVSPPLAKRPGRVAVELAHPGYPQDERESLYHLVEAETLIGQLTTLSLDPRHMRVTLRVVDERGEPVDEQICLRRPHHREHTHGEGPVFDITVRAGGEVLTLHRRDHVPTTLAFSADEVDALQRSTEPRRVVLAHGRKVTVQFVDEGGQPLTSAHRVRIDQAGGTFRRSLDDEARLEWWVTENAPANLHMHAPGYNWDHRLQLTPALDGEKIKVPRTEPEPDLERDEDESDPRPPDYNPQSIFRRLARHRPGPYAPATMPAWCSAEHHHAPPPADDDPLALRW